MEAINLLTGYAEKLKASEKLLKSLERKAKALAQKQADTDAQRHTLEGQITEHQREIVSLQDEHQDGQLSYMESVYLQDASAQREAQSRRQEIEAALRDHAAKLRELNELLEALPSFERESVELAAQLDALNWGDGWAFAMNLRDALVANESDLKSRQSEARSKLPEIDKDTYHEYRLEHDEGYRRKKASEELQARQIAHRVAENEKRYGKPGHVPKQAVVDDDGIIVGYR